MGFTLVYLKRTNKLGGKNDLLPVLETWRMGWSFMFPDTSYLAEVIRIMAEAMES